MKKNMLLLFVALLATSFTFSNRRFDSFRKNIGMKWRNWRIYHPWSRLRHDVRKVITRDIPDLEKVRKNQNISPETIQAWESFKTHMNQANAELQKIQDAWFKKKYGSTQPPKQTKTVATQTTAPETEPTVSPSAPFVESEEAPPPYESDAPPSYEEATANKPKEI